VADLPSRLLQSPRVGLGVTTAALIALATGGTSLLLSQATNQLQPQAPHAAAPPLLRPDRVPVVVDRAPGSVPVAGSPVVGPARVSRPAAPVTAPPAAADPLVPVVPPVVIVPEVPVLPDLQPPVEEPPVAGPPAEEPPVLDPDVTGERGRGGNRPPHPDDQGKHLGQLKR
jgi:hypothetical protein